MAEGIGSIGLTRFEVRNVDNDPILVLGEGGTIRVDCTPPMMESIIEPADRYYNAPPVR